MNTFHSYKKLLLSALLYIAMISLLQAEVITVDNNLNSPADYTSLQEAITAANSGDTIYVSASLGDITIQKKLALYGPGLSPNNQFKRVATIGLMNLSNYAGTLENNPTSASGTRIEGFDCKLIKIDVPSGESIISNVTIKRNLIRGHGDAIFLERVDGIAIINNVIHNQIDSGNDDAEVTNVIVANNIITYEFGDLVQSSILFTNNLISRHASHTSSTIFGSRNLLFTNNIFYGAVPGAASDICDGCTFNNSISYDEGATDFDYGTNVTSGNKEGTNPMFMGGSDFKFHRQGLCTVS